MTRALPAGLATEIAKGTNSLATILEIRRRDGARIRLTDHSAAVEIDSRTYQSVGGYERSALSVRDGFEVDDMEITGHYNASWGVSEDDIIDRLFAGAPFTMWLVSPANIGAGKAVLHTGQIGRMRPSADGTWRAELRGIKNALRQTITRTYTYECSAQLGDDRCRIPLAPPEVQRSAAYAVGDFVRVATHASAAARFAVPIVNPGFEAHTGGVPDSWTVLRGSPESVTADDPLNPANGSRFLEGADGASEFAIEQTVGVDGLGVSNAVLDAGDARVSVSIARSNGGRLQRDLGRVLVEALDAGGAVLGDVYDSGFERNPLEGVWWIRHATEATLPAGTRSIRIEIDGRRRSETRCQAAFDDVHAQIWDGSGGLGQEQWENRIYECTGGGTTAASAPAYNTGIGSTTGDGGATFTARESWMKHATIASVTDQQTFALTVTESRAVDDWFNHGVVHWETGNNAGLGMEIKDWTQSSGNVVLFLPMNRTIVVGDKVRIFPGCARYLSLCRDKFDNVRQYRGFPHIPGQDFMNTYPGAR